MMNEETKAWLKENVRINFNKRTTETKLFAIDMNTEAWGKDPYFKDMEGLKIKEINGEDITEYKWVGEGELVPVTVILENGMGFMCFIDALLDNRDVGEVTKDEVKEMIDNDPGHCHEKPQWIRKLENVLRRNNGNE